MKIVGMDVSEEFENFEKNSVNNRRNQNSGQAVVLL